MLRPRKLALIVIFAPVGQVPDLPNPNNHPLSNVLNALVFISHLPFDTFVHFSSLFITFSPVRPW
jgi:hypothetical protein